MTWIFQQHVIRFVILAQANIAYCVIAALTLLGLSKSYNRDPTIRLLKRAAPWAHRDQRITRCNYLWISRKAKEGASRCRHQEKLSAAETVGEALLVCGESLPASLLGLSLLKRSS